MIIPQGELVTCIVNRVDEIIRACGAARIAVSGVDCAGKSNLAQAVHKRLTALGISVTCISMDDFLIPAEVRARRSPEFLGYFEDAFDYRALARALETAQVYQEGGSGRRCTPSTRQGTVTLVEGVFLLRRELRHWWDVMVWLDIDPALALERAVERDVACFGEPAAVRRVYKERCQPAQAYHERRDRPRESAQIIARFEHGMWSLQVSA